MNFSEIRSKTLRTANLERGHISTCADQRIGVKPVISNGKIVSVDDKVTVSPQTVLTVGAPETE